MLSILLMSASAAAAESFSIRCEGSRPAQDRTPYVYFATFDPDRKLVVFESASPVNLYSGEIVSDRDGRLEVALKVDQGRLYFFWDAGPKRVLWPGIHEDPFRPTLSHNCRVTPVRSILSFRELAEIPNPVSLHCEAHPPGMFFTFDTATAKVLYQRKGGGTYSGKIEKSDDNSAAFRLSSDETRLIVWDRRKNTVTVEGVGGDPQRPETIYQCEPVTPQSMLEYHDRLR
ncbi:MAG: hypothetical protein GY844_34540 [Bradyrhizobium sp.]|nr:hypothetical protein [Bradyrhizobium sp.]